MSAFTMTPSGAEPIVDGTAFVTVRIAGQLFGMPIERVHDMFVVPELTRVPLSPPEVAGLLNLRGRVVTAIDLRQRLGLPPSEAPGRRMAVGIDDGGDSYGLIVDGVGEVRHLDPESRDDLPVHLEPLWAGVAAGIHRLPSEILVVLNVAAILGIPRATPSSGDVP